MCRICAPVITISEFVQERNTWNLSAIKHLDGLGHYGSPAELKMITIGKNRKGYAFLTGDMHMGYSGSVVNIFAKVGNEYLPVFRLITAEDNKGACEAEKKNCYSNQSTFEFVSSDRPWFDILVERKGTRAEGLPDNARILSVNQTEIWEFTVNSYRKR